MHFFKLICDNYITLHGIKNVKFCKLLKNFLEYCRNGMGITMFTRAIHLSVF